MWDSADLEPNCAGYHVVSGWPRSRFLRPGFASGADRKNSFLKGRGHQVVTDREKARCCERVQGPSVVSLVQNSFLEDEESLMAAGATAAPSTSLRSGRDDNSVEAGIDATRQ
jgi:hypothetical protein